MRVYDYLSRLALERRWPFVHVACEWVSAWVCE